MQIDLEIIRPGRILRKDFFTKNNVIYINSKEVRNF